jgi:hypothetical protein
VIRRAARLEAIVAAKRDLHPDLVRPLTWSRLQAVCRREGIYLCCVPTTEGAAGAARPLLRSVEHSRLRRDRPARALKLAAHELGHLWAHHDPQHERWELVYQIMSPAPGGAQEREADGIAFLLLEGRTTFPPARAEGAGDRCACGHAARGSVSAAGACRCCWSSGSEVRRQGADRVSACSSAPPCQRCAAHAWFLCKITTDVRGVWRLAWGKRDGDGAHPHQSRRD